jgi:hypothetical protein
MMGDFKPFRSMNEFLAFCEKRSWIYEENGTKKVIKLKPPSISSSDILESVPSPEPAKSAKSSGKSDT